MLNFFKKKVPLSHAEMELRQQLREKLWVHEKVIQTDMQEQLIRAIQIYERYEIYKWKQSTIYGKDRKKVLTVLKSRVDNLLNRLWQERLAIRYFNHQLALVEKKRFWILFYSVPVEIWDELLWLPFIFIIIPYWIIECFVYVLWVYFKKYGPAIFLWVLVVTLNLKDNL